MRFLFSVSSSLCALRSGMSPITTEWTLSLPPNRLRIPRSSCLFLLSLFSASPLPSQV